MPESALRCIESWKKHCPGYEIKRWDESNYDVNNCTYIREAYAAKKWAFVSDYARFDILYTHGGMYFDTDVELIAPIRDILETGPFLGVERNVEQQVMVAPGLGMAAPAGMPVYAKMLEDYRKMHFVNQDGSYNQTTIVRYTTDLLKEFGLRETNQPQQVAGIWIYPWDYFCPMMYQTGELTITANTKAIHHYDASWLSKEELRNHCFQTEMCKRFGSHIGKKLGRIQSFPYRVKKKFLEKGFLGTVWFVLEKMSQK